MMPRRTLLVDDERLPRSELREMLAVHSDVTVIGEADTIESAARMIAAERPDLVFLDIQLGSASGFDLLAGGPVPFDVIFVTAHEAHALRAFEVDAIDYLLKPVHPERLAAALRRCAPPDETRAASPGRSLDAEDRLFIRAGDRWRFLKVGTIVVIEAAGDFTRVRTREGDELLLGRSLAQWEATLPPRLFARIHRSTIMNLEHVERVEEWSALSFLVYVRGWKEPYAMSRRRASRLRA
jgi:two-component system, LytTR family, response regulator